MTILCDFTVIQDSNRTIGDAGPAFTRNFSTGGRHDSQAMLMVNVRGLTDSHAVVRINGKVVKPLQPNTWENRHQWFSQHMVLPSDLLSPNSNQNEITISRVLETGSSGGTFDDFIIRDLVLFFHQNG